MAKPSVKPSYVKTIQMLDALVADALHEYMKARVSKPTPVVAAAASIDDTKPASKTAGDAKATSSNITDSLNAVPNPVDDTKSASKTADDAPAASNIMDSLKPVPNTVDDAKAASSIGDALKAIPDTVEDTKSASKIPDDAAAASKIMDSLNAVPGTVDDIKAASSKVVEALNAIPDTLDDVKVALDTLDNVKVALDAVDDVKVASANTIDPNTQAATHKQTTSVSSVQSWDSIGSTIVEVDTSTPITSKDDYSKWLSAIKLLPSDLSSPAVATWAESDGTIYRNGHAHGVTTSTHHTTVKELQSSAHHLRKLNTSMTDDLSGALNVVAWEADTRVADIERLHHHALQRAEKRGNARVTATLIKQHKDVVASLEEKHKAAMADLRAEQKTTVWTLLKNHRSKMAFMEMAQKKEVALIREEHEKETVAMKETHAQDVVAIEEKHEQDVVALSENHEQDVAAIQRENACALDERQKEVSGAPEALDEEGSDVVASLENSVMQAGDVIITALQQAVADKDAQIATLTERAASLEAEVASTVGAMQAGDVVVASLEQTVAEKDTEIATVTARLTSLEDEVSASLKSMNAEGERAVALQKSVDEKQVEIDRILSEVATEVESHAAEVESLQKNHKGEIDRILSEVAGEVNSHAAEVESLKQQHEGEIDSIRVKYDKGMASIEKKHSSNLDFVFCRHGKVVAAMESDHESEIESLRSEFDAKVAAIEMNYESQITNLEADLTASLRSLEHECDATTASHQAGLNHIEVELTGALLSLDESCTSTLAVHESTINILEVELTVALTSLNDECNSTLASHEANLRTIEVEILTSLQSLDDECTSTIASLTANSQAAENTVIYQELVSLEPVAPECDTLKPSDFQLVFQEFAVQEPSALEFIDHESSSNELVHQELIIQEPIAQEPIIQESDEQEPSSQDIVDNDLDYPTSSGQDFTIYCDPSPSPANSASTVVRRSSSPFTYETSPLFAAEQQQQARRPSPLPFINPAPFTGVWAAHASLQNALSNVTAVSSPPLGEQKVGALLEAAPIDEAAPITAAPKRIPSPTKQKLVTKEEWKALVASLNGSGSNGLAARSAEAEARRAAELAEEARELAEEDDDVLAVYEDENASPETSISTPRPLPDPTAAADLSPSSLAHENAALRAEIDILRSHITALTATNEHNSAAYLAAKATAEHNERAATEAAACLEAQADLAKDVEAELTAASRDLEAAEQRCTAAAARADQAEQRAEQAETCAQQLDRVLRNVALDTMYLHRLEWNSKSQAAHVRRLLDERVPLENAVARLHNENLRLKTQAEETKAGSDAVFAYAENIAGGMLALLRQAARVGVVNVATLAERTNDEVVRGLADYMQEFIDAANGNVREGWKLVGANRDLVAAAAADRDAIDALKEEIVQLKDSLADARTEVDDVTVGEQLAQAELEKAKGCVAELKAAADRVPGLERKVDDLQYALNEAREGAAPAEWKEVVEDMQMQLAAKQACLDTVTIRLTTLNNVDEEHALCERREKSAHDQCETNRRIISALTKRNHRLVEELTLTRERAGLPKGTYLIYNFTENEFSKAVLRAMLMRFADVHKYDLMAEDFAFCDEVDRILDQPIEETEVQPLDREFTAAENIMNGVLDKITTVCKDVMDDGKEGQEIKHRGLDEKAVTDSEESWEPLDLSIDPEVEKENNERFEAEQERRKKAAEELRTALLKADEDDQILADESF